MIRAILIGIMGLFLIMTVVFLTQNNHSPTLQNQTFAAAPAKWNAEYIKHYGMSSQEKSCHPSSSGSKCNAMENGAMNNQDIIIQQLSSRINNLLERVDQLVSKRIQFSRVQSFEE